MSRYFAIVLCALATALPVRAAVIFGLQQTVPGPITVGSSAEFKVTVYSDSGTVNNLAGIDFVIDANDPVFTGTATAGGRFVSGTNVMFAPNGGFALAFPSSFQVYGANAGSGLTVTGTPATVATLMLDTAGATPGSYSMKLSSQLAVDPLFNALPITGALPLNYSIADVPEPAALSLIMCTGLLIRRKRL